MHVSFQQDVELSIVPYFSGQESEAVKEQNNQR
jgi:hypothetical protein